MDDKSLKSFVSDNLFALVGMSESSLAAFIVALGTRCDSPSACLRVPA